MEMAQSSLNAVTEASNELMLQHGMVDIYQQTRQDLLQLLSSDNGGELSSLHQNDLDAIAAAPVQHQQPPSHVVAVSDESARDASVIVEWEYMGNEDGQVHGPFSTADMIGWTQAGYFIGDQAVQVRSIITTSDAATNNNNNQASLQDDLLADLMDDDDDQQDGEHVNGSKTSSSATTTPPTVVRGEWVSSNQVRFASYV
jgi:CD2 antigen cytoplasmic tail-binding protein 2